MIKSDRFIERNPPVSQSSDLLLIPVPLYLGLLRFKPSVLHQHLYLFFSQAGFFLHLHLQSLHLSNRLVTTTFRISEATASQWRAKANLQQQCLIFTFVALEGLSIFSLCRFLCPVSLC